MTGTTPRPMPPEGYTLLREAAHLHARAAEIERAAYRLAMWRDLATAAEARSDRAKKVLAMYTALSPRTATDRKEARSQ